MNECFASNISVANRDCWSNLQVSEDAVLVKKGTDPDVDSYSAFWDNNKLSYTSLNEELQKRNITDVFVCGIAYDVCVGRDNLKCIYNQV